MKLIITFDKKYSHLLIFCFALTLAILMSTIPHQSVFASASEPGDSGESNSGEILAGNGPTSTCANHVWVDPSGGALTVKGTVDSTAKEFRTPLSKLTFGDGSIKYAFCTDVHHQVGSNQSYCLDSSFFTDWRILWVINNYPPDISSKINQAARQAVVWHLTDGFELNQSDPTTSSDSGIDTAVKNAYNTILAAIPATAPVEYTDGALQLVIDPDFDANLLPFESDHSFTVSLTKGGEPLVGYTLNVTTDFGSLDKASDTTDSNGQAQFMLTSTLTGTAHLNASATVSLPEGFRYLHATDPNGKQKLSHGGMEDVEVTAQAEKVWVDKMDFGDLPEGDPLPYNMTTFANNGARHYTPVNNIYLGSLDDIEANGQPSTSANGDNNLGLNDEDGVVRNGAWVSGLGHLQVTVNGSGAGCLMGWLDYYTPGDPGLFEPDGAFEISFSYNGGTYSEVIIDNLYVTTGVHNLDFQLPPGVPTENVGLYARFRLVPYDSNIGMDENSGKCNQTPVGLKGLALGGEVEDYVWLFGPTAVSLQGFSAMRISSNSWTGFIILVLSISVLGILWRILRNAQG